jgi:hypothetical protein
VTVEWWGIPQRVAGVAMAGVVSDEGVQSTVDGACVAGGCAGIVVGIEDEELREANDSEFVVGLEWGWAGGRVADMLRVGGV